MAWQLDGTYFERRSCRAVSPCTASMALGADYDRCKATLVFHVLDGDAEGTDVSGLNVAAIADTPKVMSDGNRRLGLFIEAAATDERAEKPGAVLGGRLGGPMKALAPLVSENLGVRGAPIEVREDGPRHRVTIGDAIEFEIEDVVSFGVESGEAARLRGRRRSRRLRADDRQRPRARASTPSASNARAKPPPRTRPSHGGLT
jgi:hypothetical protein